MNTIDLTVCRVPYFFLFCRVYCSVYCNYWPGRSLLLHFLVREFRPHRRPFATVGRWSPPLVCFDPVVGRSVPVCISRLSPVGKFPPLFQGQIPAVTRLPWTTAVIRRPLFCSGLRQSVVRHCRVFASVDPAVGCDASIVPPLRHFCSHVVVGRSPTSAVRRRSSPTATRAQRSRSKVADQPAACHRRPFEVVRRRRSSVAHESGDPRGINVHGYAPTFLLI